MKSISIKWYSEIHKNIFRRDNITFKMKQIYDTLKTVTYKAINGEVRFKNLREPTRKRESRTQIIIHHITKMLLANL